MCYYPNVSIAQLWSKTPLLSLLQDSKALQPFHQKRKLDRAILQQS